MSQVNSENTGFESSAAKLSDCLKNMTETEFINEYGISKIEVTLKAKALDALYVSGNWDDVHMLTKWFDAVIMKPLKRIVD